jgi:hypothetical protein
MDSITFNHPLQLKLSGIKCPLDPSLFPGKKFDELYGSDQLIQDPHALISSSQDSFLNSDTSARDVAVQRPANDKDNKASECTPPEKSLKHGTSE